MLICSMSGQRAVVAPLRARSVRPEVTSHEKSRARGHRRRAACMNRADHLGVVDPLQIDQVTPRSACPSCRWITLSGTPSRAISTACAWRSWCGANRRLTPAAVARWRSCSLAAEPDHGRPRVGPLTTQKSAPTGISARCSSQGRRCSQPQSSMPDSRRLPPFPRRMRRAPRSGSRSASARSRASLMRSPARHRTTIRPRSRAPWTPSPAWRITATISSTLGGSTG
jgi:hypothetical protein